MDRWKYKGLGRVRYGHPESYERPAAWFDELGGVVEDWGCGCAFFKEYVKKCKYIGVEGSMNDWVDRHVDLRNYRSTCDHILLRGVIDHNEDWELVVQNAIASFQKRMVVMIFHALGPRTKKILTHTSGRYPGVIDMQFCLSDLMKYFLPYLVKVEDIPAVLPKYINNEILFYLEKKDGVQQVQGTGSVPLETVAGPS